MSKFFDQTEFGLILIILLSTWGGCLFPCYGDEAKEQLLYSQNVVVSTPEPITSAWDDLSDGIKTPKDWSLRRAILMEKYLALISDEAKPVKPPLELRWEESTEVDGVYTRWLVSYQVEEDERARAFIGIPKGIEGKKLPAVIALHGTNARGMHQIAGLEEDRDRIYFDELTRRGFITIAPEHFVAEYRIPEEGAYDTSAFYRKHPHWTAVGKFTYEHAIALDVLVQIPEVDATRIGVMGHSLGGQGSIFLAAYDRRIKAAAANCAAFPFRQTNEVSHWARDKWYVYFLTMRKKLKEEQRLPDIDHAHIMALIAPRAFLDCSGLNDGNRLTQRQRVLMLMKVMDIYEVLGAADHFSFYVHGRQHSIKRESRELLYTWLQENL